MAAARKAPAKTTLLVAKDGFICSIKGTEVIVKQGEKVSSNHPAAKQHPELFEPAQEAAA